MFRYRFGYYPFRFGYKISSSSISIRLFCYFNSDFGSGFSDRVLGKMSDPNSYTITKWFKLKVN